MRVGLRAILDLMATAPGELGRELAQDLRFAVRVYRKRALSAGFTLVVLSLAIGATTTYDSQRRDYGAWADGQAYFEDVAYASSKATNLLLEAESFRVNLERSAEASRQSAPRSI